MAKLNLFGDGVARSAGLSNQLLISQLEKAFVEVMNRESFDDQLMYDCSFLILMRPEDYHRSELRLPRIVEGIVRRFYKIIEKKRTRYANYQPMGNYWYFHFCPQENGPDKKEIPEGKVHIVSTPTTLKQDWGEVLDQNLISSGLISVSLNGKHSKFSKYDLNMDALGGIDILEKGKLRLKFNPELVFSSGDFAKDEPKETNALGVLSFEQNHTRKSYNIISDQVDVGMAAGPTELSSTARLNIFEPDGNLQREHFRIRYDKNTKIFYIALFGPARVNEERLSESVDKSNPVWHRLKQRSAILCGMFQVNFEALK